MVVSLEPVTFSFSFCSGVAIPRITSSTLTSLNGLTCCLGLAILDGVGGGLVGPGVFVRFAAKGDVGRVRFVEDGWNFGGRLIFLGPERVRGSMVEGEVGGPVESERDFQLSTRAGLVTCCSMFEGLTFPSTRQLVPDRESSNGGWSQWVFTGTLLLNSYLRWLETTAGAQQAVSIPEIVGYILSFVDTEDVRRAALVCHAWSSSSLPFIWETLRSLLPLLRILSRLKKLNDGQWVSQFLLYRRDGP